MDTYTEEEFKKVLKNLFVEKRRSQELERELTTQKEEIGKLHTEKETLMKKFQAKLRSTPPPAEKSEEMAELRARCVRLEEQLATAGASPDMEHMEALTIQLVQQKEEAERIFSDMNAALRDGQEELFFLKKANNDLTLECEEKEGERLKAQQHLAKKVKETTQLYDRLERQEYELSQLRCCKEEIVQLREMVRQLKRLLNVNETPSPS